MEDFYTEATKYSLEIDLNSNGVFNLSGRSFPENTFEYYEPMLIWIKKYFITSPAETTKVNINITYCNSSSTMLLFDLFDIFLNNKQNNIEIIWSYDPENDSMEEMGQDLIEEYQDLNIKLVEAEDQ